MELKGNGALIDSQSTETPVQYSFDIHQEIVRQPGLAPALGRAPYPRDHHGTSWNPFRRRPLSAENVGRSAASKGPASEGDLRCA